MSHLHTRSVVPCLLTAAALLLTGCGGAVGGTPTTPGASSNPAGGHEDISEVNPCDLLPPEKATSFGLGQPNAKEPEKVLNGVGCQYRGDPFVVLVSKNEDIDLDRLRGNRDKYAEFEDNKVNGRPGARIVVRGGSGHGLCTQAFAYGRGSIDVELTYHHGKFAGKDPCADAMAVAQAVESQLPR
ncbi:Protein of unknown function (DUF3558) [Streptoalloteichus tenebrarius]|uniref:DUF3558 domain-containing protein n=1 Tax=Streptoalloteichus tenebrarius (strain ATCC 17920 / DSM 40477 / JCM 4838 / CBS 697.72 / NBRC 16177 / NCIMB 11028 / NRRL B-12390 / A12253. 1 / ISP 5477) TaxID=1933 RepID=A0ABT1I2N3_STRSD|nr:DUF3558 domain-containing protein [Streptoalloteichus tenebrarius]MCP2262048.1 Protein of unknown function (DUF3558) [Streptoalloteichus tenebrarius]BFF01312.1 hypothetical protein GCM10020241_29870 [Streptoalloteichus tenebrarius]